MRPVSKVAWPTDADGNPKSFNPHQKAIPDLILNLDNFCSYCEIFSSDLEVEHVISKNQNSGLAHDWGNFLLACGKCNGKGNKSNKNVVLEDVHFPHRNNTFLSFTYVESGVIQVNSALTGASLKNATNLYEMVGLGKVPGHPQHHNNDKRWQFRFEAWENAKKYLAKYEAGNLTADEIVDYIKQRGFFSIWFTVFKAHSEVRRSLISEFAGTTVSCFDADNHYDPKSRNPTSLTDII